MSDMDFNSTPYRHGVLQGSEGFIVFYARQATIVSVYWCPVAPMRGFAGMTILDQAPVIYIGQSTCRSEWPVISERKNS
jgi:hypothetical protein